MQLRYRGLTYDYNPPAFATDNAETTGKYRGLDWRFRNAKKPLILDSNLEFTYRGVKYRKGEPAVQSAPQDAKVPAVSVANQARALMLDTNRAIKKRQQSMLSRLTREVGMEADANYWNRIQGKIHPTFRTNYDRSASALS